MKRVARIALPLVIVAVSVLIGMILINTGPEAERRPPRTALPTVKVQTVQPGDYTVLLHTRGTVTPRTQSTLIPEISGRIVEVSPNFRSGGFFERDEILVRIDSRDYEYALTVARAELERARLSMAEERAQAEQAKRDWEKLRFEGKPDELVLRRPQLQSAEAAVAAAQAQVRRAELNLQRTTVRAPYAGRVLEKNVDIGQYISPGTVLAKLYAVDYVEVRLPLTDRQAAFVDLPEAYRNQPQAVAGPAVTINAAIGGRDYQWQARIVRTEGAIDTRSRQLFVVAQVDDPYAKREDQRPPLKVGQFVTAAIQGRELTGVYVVPRAALLGVDELIVVDQENTVERRRVEIVWRDEDEIVVSKGLKPGERISVTLLPFITSGSKVQIAGAQGNRGSSPTAPGGQSGSVRDNEKRAERAGSGKKEKKKSSAAGAQ